MCEGAQLLPLVGWKFCSSLILQLVSILFVVYLFIFCECHNNPLTNQGEGLTFVLSKSIGGAEHLKLLYKYFTCRGGHGMNELWNLKWKLKFCPFCPKPCVPVMQKSILVQWYSNIDVWNHLSFIRLLNYIYNL